MKVKGSLIEKPWECYVYLFAVWISSDLPAVLTLRFFESKAYIRVVHHMSTSVAFVRPTTPLHSTKRTLTLCSSFKNGVQPFLGVLGGDERTFWENCLLNIPCRFLIHIIPHIVGKYENNWATWSYAVSILYNNSLASDFQQRWTVR
jgi:uncharacterized membrane protein